MPVDLLNHSQPLRVLSLDGGGIRGIITAAWLDRLEGYLQAEHPNSKLADYFDIVAGTSTGSILACAIAQGTPARQIIDMYLDKGEVVFPPSGWFRLDAWQAGFRRLKGIAEEGWRVFFPNAFAPKYSGRGLDEVLQGVFKGECFFRPNEPQCVVTGFDAFSGMPVIFNSTNPNFAHLRTWEVVRASCAAPTYFPAMPISFGPNQSGLVDGGIAANNPTSVAAVEAIKRLQQGTRGHQFDPNQLFIASFGAGYLKGRVSLDSARRWGTVEWMPSIIDLMFTGSTEVVDHTVRHLVPPGNFYRIELPLCPKMAPMDKADREHLNQLVCLAREYVLSGEGRVRLDALVDRLKAEGPISRTSRPTAEVAIPPAPPNSVFNPSDEPAAGT